jgi:hypothetical protein
LHGEIMSFEIMGLVTVMVGMAILALPVPHAFMVMTISTVFGAAAAISLPAMGGSSILVPNVFLMFYALRIFMAWGEGPLLAALQPFRPGFWLLVLTLFGVLTAITYPGLFKGVTETMIVERTAGARSIIALVPLKFSTNNITQTVYAIGGLLCFMLTFAFFRRGGTPAHFVTALVAVAAIDLGFALADIVTYFAGMEWVLGFVRTANYALLTAAEKGGLKRISGTFPEASAFADFTVVLFAVVATLWLARVRQVATGILTGFLMLALLLSTSATGLIGIAVITPLLWSQSMLASMRRAGSGRPMVLVGVVAALPLVALAMPILFPDALNGIIEYVDEMLLSKADSQSGRERGMWNQVALQTFLDTSGIGAGLGSARASSFVLVLLSNIGIPGFLLFATFVVAILTAKSPLRTEISSPEHLAVVRAAKNGVFATLVTVVVSGTGYDLGLMFYILAGSVAALAYPAAVPFIPLTGTTASLTRRVVTLREQP